MRRAATTSKCTVCGRVLREEQSPYENECHEYRGCADPVCKWNYIGMHWHSRNGKVGATRTL